MTFLPDSLQPPDEVRGRELARQVGAPLAEVDPTRLAGLLPWLLPSALHTVLGAAQLPPEQRPWHVHIGPVDTTTEEPVPVRFAWPGAGPTPQAGDPAQFDGWDGYTLDLVGWPIPPDGAWDGIDWHLTDPDATPALDCHLYTWLVRITPNTHPHIHADVLSVSGDYAWHGPIALGLRQHVSVHWAGGLIPNDDDYTYHHPRLTTAEVAAIDEGIRRVQSVDTRIRVRVATTGPKRRARDEARIKLIRAASQLGPFETIWDLEHISRPALANVVIKSVRTIGNWLDRAEWGLDELREYIRQQQMPES